MTREEAAQVASILATADGGCSTCVRNLFEQARSQWPEHASVFGGDEEEYDCRKRWRGVVFVVENGEIVEKRRGGP